MPTRAQRIDLQTGLAVASLAAGLAVPIALYVWLQQPFLDPVGIVGLPAINGYSERSEFLGLVALVGVAAILAFGGAQWLLWRPPGDDSVTSAMVDRWKMPIAMLGTLACVGAGACVRGGFGPLLAAAVGCCGWPLARLSTNCPRNSFLFFGLLSISIACFPELAMSIASSPIVIVAPLLLLAAASLFRRNNFAALRDSIWAIAALLCVVSVLAGMPDRIVEASAGFLVVALSHYSRSCADRTTSRELAWSQLAALMLGSAIYWDAGWTIGSWQIPIRNVGGGVAIGLLAMLTWRPSKWLGRCSSFSAVRGEWMSFAAMVLGWSVLAYYRPWVGVWCAAAFLIGRARRIPLALRLAAITACCAVFYLPGLIARRLDAFHDGQILSAVWELRSGRSLYQEVFPLRSFELFTTWLAFEAFGAKPPVYFAVESLTTVFVSAGMFLATAAWSRRWQWGIAAALGSAWLPLLDGRLAIPFFLAAISLAAMRSQRPWIWHAGGSTLANLAGMDCFLPYVAGIGAALLLAPSRHRMRQAAGVAAAVMTWCVLVALWQGRLAASWYWQLTWDFAHQYGAFFGRPMPWETREFTPLMCWPIAALAAWCAGGAALISRMRCTKRQQWAFVAVQSAMLLQRGLGRSDWIHLKSMTYPAFFITVLIALESARTARASWGGGLGLAWMKTAGVAIAIAGALQSSQGFQTFAGIASDWSNMASSTPPWPEAVREIAELTSPGDFVWEMEDGLLAFQCERHNPTRHALAYCIGTPAEQRHAAVAIETAKPAAIVWRFDSGTDGIANPLRFFRIVPAIYRNYVPRSDSNLLVRRSSAAEMPTALDERFVRPMFMGRLPLEWGKRLLGKGNMSAAPEIVWRYAFQGGKTVATSANPVNSQPTDVLAIEAELAPLAAGALDGPSVSTNQPLLELHFGAGNVADRRGPIQFAVNKHAGLARYLVPVGCHPNWGWRRRLDAVQLVPPDGFHIKDLKAWLLNHEIFD